MNIIDLFLPRRGAAETFDMSSPLSPFWYSIVGAPTASKVSVSEQTAMTYSAVWAASRLFGGTLGWLPLNMYRRLAKGGREVANKDPRDRLVHMQPNAEMSAMMGKTQAVIQQINAGNAYFEIQRRLTDEGTVAALWPIHHTRAKAKRTADGELYYEIQNNDGTTTPIPAEDMLHFPSTISDDGISGKGVIANARESIGMGIATERYGAAWFGKGAVPRVVIEDPQRTPPDAREAFRKEWSEIYGGADGSRVALLQGGAKAVALNISNEDSQFLQTREHNVNEIARWYGIPPHKLADLRRATFSNIEEQNLEWVTDGLLPCIKIWEQELWKKLLSENEKDEYYFEFNVNALLRGNVAARSSYYRTMVTLGLFNRNEVREFENMNPVPGGDVFMVQGAMVPLDDDGEPIQPESETAPALPGDPEKPFQDASSVKRKPKLSKYLKRLTDAVLRNQTPDVRAEKLERMKAAAKGMMEQSLRKFMLSEIRAAREAANKPAEFNRKVEEFYAKHQELLTESIRPAVEALNACDVEANPVDLAASVCSESQRLLFDASNVLKDGELSESVSRCVSDWVARRIPAIIASLTEQSA